MLVLVHLVGSSSNVSPTTALGDLESVRLAPAQYMHRAAWRGLLCHGDELLERGDLRPVPPFGRVAGGRADSAH